MAMTPGFEPRPHWWEASALKRSQSYLHYLHVLCYLLFLFSAVPLHYGLEFDISLPSILQVVFFVLLLIMAGRHSWRGMYKVLIPYLVCLLWWQLFTELFHFTTWSSLLRATLGWVIFVTTLPLLILFTVGLAVTYFVQRVYDA